MEHILNPENEVHKLEPLFKKIQEGNTILFLGAGASVGEKKYLSKEIIDFYESEIELTLNQTNITKWIDILSANVKFSRSHFDNFVYGLLKKLDVTEGHKIMAGIPWQEIITTNYDLLVERAFDSIEDSSNKLYEIKPIKSLKEYYYRGANNEVKYIKLNGCISDKSKYPLAFSSDDFRQSNKFYKEVLNGLRNLSPRIEFLSVGYSFSDEFADQLLQKFDSYNYRDKKWIINIDPYPNENALDYYTSQRVCIIKSSFEGFFNLYQKWQSNHLERSIKKRNLSISNSKNQYIQIPQKLLINLEGIVKQLNRNKKDFFIKDEDFYKGEEPNYEVITRGLDVVKKKDCNGLVSSLTKTIDNNSETFLPVFFISGQFGIGKTTFTLRLIYELEKLDNIDVVAFEIIDFNRIRIPDLVDLVKSIKAKYVLLYCDDLEIESHFKSFLDIQRQLSIEQVQDSSIFFIAPIRENILEKYKRNKVLKNSIEIPISSGFEDDELNILLDKLKVAGLINFRDLTEKTIILKKIKKDFNSDSFITLMSLITSGKHENDLIQCYQELSQEAQKAFLFTALVHRHKLHIPASWLKRNINLDWEQFVNNIIRVEGKGILIQEVVNSRGSEPDLFFRTKHPLIADKLVNRIVPNIDKQFNLYKDMFGNLESGRTNSFLANNLLKSLSKSDYFSVSQINTLYDKTNQNLGDDPYFLLSYSSNLQKRGSKKSIKKAIEYLLYAESLLEFRNHKFIHRRAALNFDLAKIFYDEENQSLIQTNFYLNEAKELFILKQQLDPFSSFSYVDYIKLLLWELNNLVLDEEDKLQKQILLENQFDVASRAVLDNVNRIDELQHQYALYLDKNINNKDYKVHLDILYENPRLRPYACILLHNFYTKVDNKVETGYLLTEMEEMQDNREVVKFLFKNYGRKLNDANNRIKLFRLCRDNEFLEIENPLRYYYFNFMAEFYNSNFGVAWNYLKQINNRHYTLNPEFHYMWKDLNDDITYFDAIIISSGRKKFKEIKVLSSQMKAKLIKGNYDEYPIGSKVRVQLHFYLYGLLAEIVEVEKNN